MIKLLYLRMSPLLTPFFLLTTVVMFCICVWRGEVILGLQTELLKDKNQVVEVIVKQQESATKISQEYEERKADREQEKIYVEREVEKIITVPSYSNICFDDTGLQFLNSEIAKVNSSGKSESALPTDTGAN